MNTSPYGFLENLKKKIEAEQIKEEEFFNALSEQEKARVVAEREKQRLEKIAEEEAEERRIQETKWKRKGITPRYFDEYWDTWKADTPDKKKAFEDVRSAWENNLLLMGKNGTGKTHLAMSLTKDGAVYRTAAEIFRSIRVKFEDEYEIIKHLGEVKLLIIDEIGRTKDSPFEKGVLFEIVDSRWQNMRPTTLITNMEPAAFSEEYGTGILDRLRPIVVKFNWKSMRGEK
jgi:DNA replication protein DnaC